jgi:hypothetical protein
MRISKKALYQGWLWTTLFGASVYAALLFLDMQLRSLSGVSTANLEDLVSALQYHLAFHAWGPESLAARAGFLLGFAYLLMPLYALSFFFSGVIVAERFTPQGNRLRRFVLLAAMVAPAGAILDAALKGLQVAMLIEGADETLARFAGTLAQAKTIAMLIGLALLVGAIFARLDEGRRKV